MAYQSWSVVFGEQPSAAKWNILGTNDAYFDALVGSGTAWETWSPSYANLTIGNGTVVSIYSQIGKTVNMYFKFTLGSTSAVGTAPTITLPVTAVATSFTDHGFATGRLSDANAVDWLSYGLFDSTTVLQIAHINGASNIASVTATAPFTWVTTDFMTIQAVYQAA